MFFSRSFERLLDTQVLESFIFLFEKLSIKQIKADPSWTETDQRAQTQLTIMSLKISLSQKSPASFISIYFSLVLEQCFPAVSTQLNVGVNIY